MTWASPASMFSAILTTFLPSTRTSACVSKPDLGSTTRPFLISNIIFQLSILLQPINWGLALRYKVSIGFWKRLAAKKTTIGRQGTRMGTLNNGMLWIGNQSFLLTSIATPKYKDNRSILLIENLNHSICKWFPNLTGMPICLTSGNRQTGIKQAQPMKLNHERVSDPNLPLTPWEYFSKTEEQEGYQVLRRIVLGLDEAHDKGPDQELPPALLQMESPTRH